jgi:hypothetical protein
LIVQDISGAGRVSKVLRYVDLLNGFHILIIKNEPVSVGLDYGYVVTMMWTTSYMYVDAKELIQTVRIIRVISSIEQPQLEREGDTISQLDVLLQVFLVFEPFQVESEHVGYPLDLHPLFGFLEVTARIAEEFVGVTEHLAGAELSKTGRHAGILFYVYRQV